MAIKLHQDFKDFLKLLNSNEIEYLLIGGYAVGFHGYAALDAGDWRHDLCRRKPGTGLVCYRAQDRLVTENVISEWRAELREAARLRSLRLLKHQQRGRN